MWNKTTTFMYKMLSFLFYLKKKKKKKSCFFLCKITVLFPNENSEDIFFLWKNENLNELGFFFCKILMWVFIFLRHVLVIGRD